MVSHSRKVAVVLTALGIMLLATSATVLGSHFFGHGRAGRTLSSAPLPPGLAPARSSTQAPTVSPTAVPDRLGIPVTVIVADHHLKAPVSADRLNADGSLFVPPNPRAVSWASQDVAPGSGHGTIILVGHINYGGVAGAFADLADYRVGQIITLVLADGRRMNYAVAAPPIEVNKNALGPRREELFDQSHSYDLAGHPKSGRLLLLSCGGVFDNRTGHYESNIFVFALPA
jgi:Sortase domain